MARIVYGVMGDARGHVNRSLVVAQEMAEHDFLFIGGGHVSQLEAQGYRVQEVPMPATLYRSNRVNIPGTIGNAVRVFAGACPIVKGLARVIRNYDPHLILTDYEFFTPLAARRLRRPCISLDHQHILTHCSYRRPRSQRLSGFMTTTVIRTLFSFADRYLVTSFFKLPPKDRETTEVFPPVVRRIVTRQQIEKGDHVLVYQTSPTFHRLFPVLEKIDRSFVVYGFGELPQRNNIVFRHPSAQGFLRDLATCRYAITNGGHNVVSEALYLGKPVFSFPIGYAYEQFINAEFVTRLGYGAHSTAATPSVEDLRAFERRLEVFEANIARGDFFGNESIRARLTELISSQIS